jgi:hypothetical protein
MDTQHHDIVKLPETTTPTKSTILNSYFVRTIEILKSIFDKKINPHELGMREMKKSQICD